MKKLILNLIVAGAFLTATSSCDSSKRMAGSADSSKADSIKKEAMDTTKVVKPVDTSVKMPPDTMKKNLNL